MYKTLILKTSVGYQADITDSDGRPIYTTTETDTLEELKGEVENWLTGYHDAKHPGWTPINEYEFYNLAAIS